MQNDPVKIINRLPHSERLHAVSALSQPWLSGITADGNIGQELMNNIKCLQVIPRSPSGLRRIS
jgi:hypothetical protein